MEWKPQSAEHIRQLVQSRKKTFVGQSVSLLVSALAGAWTPKSEMPRKEDVEHHAENLGQCLVALEQGFQFGAFSCVVILLGQDYQRVPNAHAELVRAYGQTDAFLVRGRPQFTECLFIDSSGQHPAEPQLQILVVIEVVASRDAWESDGVFLINRVKWHTSFAGAIESGLTKMLAVGLGKIEGARVYHAHARTLGMEAVIRSVGEHVIAVGKIIGGLGVVEGAYHQTAKVTGIPAARLIACEQELLQLARSWMARRTFVAVDVLIVDGEEYQRHRYGFEGGEPRRGEHVQSVADTPRVDRIFVRDLSPLSYGTATGIGVADVVHDRLLEKVDDKAGMVNAVTSGSLSLMKMPLHFSSDHECFDVAANSVGKFDREEVTVAWIRNTLELGSMLVSQNR